MPSKGGRAGKAGVLCFVSLLGDRDLRLISSTLVLATISEPHGTELS